MARNGSGTYNLATGNPVSTNTTISSTWANNTLADIAAALTQSVSKDGQTALTGNLPAGNNKVTGLSAGSNDGDSIRFEQLFSQGAPTDIASASTVDIGAQRTNFLNITGTTAITSLGTNYNGPKMLKFTGILTLTYDATTLVTPAGGSIVTAVGDTCIAIPKSTTSGTADGWQIIAYQRVNGSPVSSALSAITTAGTSTAYTLTPTSAITAYSADYSYWVVFHVASGDDATLTISDVTTPPQLVRQDVTGAYVNIKANDIPINHRSRVTLISATKALVEELPPQTNQIQPVTATVAASALTVGLNPTALDFRSATLTTGVPNRRSVNTALSLVVTGGATLGTVSGVASRVAIIAIDNAGTVELAVANASGVSLDETGLISTTAISASATSATVYYSTTARSNVPYRLVGYAESTQTTAGTWVSAPALVQGIGGRALLNNVTNSMIRLNSSNGYGSTNTCILRYTNTITSTGSDITYADSATLGATFTINTSGVYAMSAFCQASSGTMNHGLSLNSTQLSTGIASLTTKTECLGFAFNNGGNQQQGVSVTMYLPAGSVIRHHADGVAVNATQGYFTIIKIA
jgi:hypothetical protein